MKYLILFVSLLISGAALATEKPFSINPSLASPHWPQWTHEHWVWEDRGDETTSRALIDDYLSHDISVAALVLDRPWELAVSSFQPDPNTFPNLDKLIAYAHEKDTKVVVWSVSAIGPESPNFAHAKKNNYFLNNGKMVRWWAQKSAILDYENADALSWWHSEMNRILDMGIDGWKLDGIDPFAVAATASTDFGGYWKILNGLVSGDKKINEIWNNYKYNFYTDYLNYTKLRTGKKAVVMARSVDVLPFTNLRFSFAPYEYSTACWVGDQDGNWNGLKVAIKNMRESAARGYLSFGSDIGGYRSYATGELREPLLFTRWLQLSTFNSVFENGGTGEHRPWKYSPDILKRYQTFAKIHQALVPYIYSSTAWAYEQKISLYQNVTKKKEKNWDFMLGPSLFVSSIESKNSERKFKLPEGEWLYFFDPSTGPQQGQQLKTFSEDEYPAYIKNGSILPMGGFNIDSAFSAPDANPAALNIVAFPTEGQSLAPVYDSENTGSLISYQYEVGNLKVQIKGDKKFSWLRLPKEFSEKTASIDGESAEGQIHNNAYWLSVAACKNQETQSCEIQLK